MKEVSGILISLKHLDFSQLKLAVLNEKVNGRVNVLPPADKEATAASLLTV